MKLLRISVLVVLLVALLEGSASARPPRLSRAVARGTGSVLPASSTKRPRPSDRPAGSVVTEEAPNAIALYNDYATPEHRYSSARAVVHYVVTGIDAPPLNDDDGDEVPDYVERTGEAADAAIDYYDRRGFRPIRADSGGGDARPDVYLSRFVPGTFGVAFPAARADAGAFVVVANNLDPSRTDSFASLRGTVAHELFHLVQFSYFPAGLDPPLTPWVLEGTAVALEGRVFPDLSDIVWDLQLSPWLRAPDRKLASRAYSSWLLWRYLDARAPRFLPAYLARGAAGLAATYERTTGRSFARSFHGFAVMAAQEYGSRISPLRVLSRRRHGLRSAVAPLAVHYLGLARGRKAARRLVVRLPSRSTLGVTLYYELASDIAGEPGQPRRIPGFRSDEGRTMTFRIPAALLANERVRRPTLVVSNGSTTAPASYGLALR